MPDDRKIGFYSFVVIWLFTIDILYAQAKRPTPVPDGGYGSRSLELCHPSNGVQCESKKSLYGYSSPKRVSWYIPSQLRHGDTAPVVVYLHGFFSLVPQIYESHIFHLTRQGYIVIFPQYQGGLLNLLPDMGLIREVVQQDWLNQAIKSVDQVLKKLGSKVERDAIYGYGHSLGGAMLLGWEASGGVPLAGMVLANPQVDPKKGMPEAVRKYVKIKPLAWRVQSRAVSCRVMVLTGSDDDIASPASAKEISRHLLHAKSRVVYEIQSDHHGDPALLADHFAPMTNGGLLEKANDSIEKFGGRIELNGYDHRFYYAALDALLAGEERVEFDLGVWSDNVPVKPVLVHSF